MGYISIKFSLPPLYLQLIIILLSNHPRIRDSRIYRVEKETHRVEKSEKKVTFEKSIKNIVDFLCI